MSGGWWGRITVGIKGKSGIGGGRGGVKGIRKMFAGQGGSLLRSKREPANFY